MCVRSSVCVCAFASAFERLLRFACSRDRGANRPIIHEVLLRTSKYNILWYKIPHTSVRCSAPGRTRKRANKKKNGPSSEGGAAAGIFGIVCVCLVLVPQAPPLTPFLSGRREVFSSHHTMHVKFDARDVGINPVSLRAVDDIRCACSFCIHEGSSVECRFEYMVVGTGRHSFDTIVVYFEVCVIYLGVYTHQIMPLLVDCLGIAYVCPSQ